MTPLFEEMVKLYCQWDDAEPAGGDYDDATAAAMDELAEAIVKIAAPKTVGDVMRLPAYRLRWNGLEFLIKRDASDAYDHIEGFFDLAVDEEISRGITPSLHGFNGLQLCEWLEQEYPVEETCLIS